MAASHHNPKASAKLPRKPFLKHISKAISKPAPQIPQHTPKKILEPKSKIIKPSPPKLPKYIQQKHKPPPTLKPEPLKKILPKPTLKRKLPFKAPISTPAPKSKPTQIPNPVLQSTTLKIIPTPPSTQNPTPARQYIVSDYLRFIAPGCIVWLPAKASLLPGCKVDARIHNNAFEHPAVIVSFPGPGELKMDSVVEIAIMTSCGGRTLAEASLLSHRLSLLRVKTAAHPYAKVDLNLKNGLGMKREYSYVGLQSYGIELRTLGFYEKQIGQLCLTGQSLGKLVHGIEERRKRGWRGIGEEEEVSMKGIKV